MDAIHYEKMADKLMQFRGKLPKDEHLSQKFSEQTTARLKQKIDELLQCIDWYAAFDNTGLIR